MGKAVCPQISLNLNRFLILLILVGFLVYFSILIQSITPSIFNYNVNLANSSDRKDNNDSGISKNNSLPLNKSTNNNKTDICLILLWAHVLQTDLKIPKHQLCGGGCKITRDRNKVKEAAAVVYMMKKLDANDLPDPQTRNSNQVYVWFARESTWTTLKIYGKSLAKFDNYFNWTMTYRLDADVDASMIPFTARPFVNFLLSRKLKNASSQDKISDVRKYFMAMDSQKCRRSKSTKATFPDLSKKSGLAVLISRNCDGTSGAKLRTSMIKQLFKNRLKLNLNYSCVSNKNRKILTQETVMKIASHHKFYMAFENTYHCREYITEKFWYNSLYVGSVPIVWGARKEDYLRVAPPKSFIFYDDFKSAKDFIDYINYLDKNDTAYLEYFTWRNQFECNYPQLNDKRKNFYKMLLNPFTNGYCNLCKMLNEKFYLSGAKTIRSLKKYWFGDENITCLNVKK